MNDKEWDEVMHHIRKNNKVLFKRQNSVRIPVRYEEETFEFAIIKRAEGVYGLAVF